MPTKFTDADPIFFNKAQIIPGKTKLVCFGRIDHGKVWTVESIQSYYKKNGKLDTVAPRSNKVVHLDDDITLTAGKGKNKQTRTISFSTLSYSAIWRIVEE